MEEATNNPAHPMPEACSERGAWLVPETMRESPRAAATSGFRGGASAAGSGRWKFDGGAPRRRSIPLLASAARLGKSGRLRRPATLDRSSGPAEVLKLHVQLRRVRRPFGPERAGEEDEAGDPEEAELGLAVLAQEGLEGFLRDAFAAGDGDVRVERLQVRLEAGAEDGILDVLMQREEVRVALADAGPDDARTAPRAERAEALERQEERRDAHGREALMELFFRRALDVAEEAEREVHLRLREPAEAVQLRIKRGERAAVRLGELKADEETEEEEALVIYHLSFQRGGRAS